MTTTTNTAPMTFDAAVRLVTGWPSAAAFLADMTSHGASYTPTLRDDDAAAPEPAHKEAIGIIRRECDSRGIRYYDGERLHNDRRA